MSKKEDVKDYNIKPPIPFIWVQCIYKNPQPFPKEGIPIILPTEKENYNEKNNTD